MEAAPSNLALLLATIRQLKSDVGDILDPFFPKQRAFIEAPARKKALWCTRRAAKSYTAGLYLIRTALKYPGCNCLYLGLTRMSAKGIIWKDILKEIGRKNQLEMAFNGSELTATTTNGSVIYATGVDAEEDEMRKLLGKKWKLVVIDEAQAFRIDMRTLVYGILGPAIIDQGGTICLMGTSGNITRGLFYDITLGREPGWELFQWTAYDNPYVARQWDEEIQDITKNRPLFLNTSLFKQWFLNLWCIDEGAKVYKYIAAKNDLEQLPLYSDWSYILGCDLAHSPDSTAFVVGCYSSESPNLFFVYASKHLNLDITDVALFIKKLERQYRFDVKVIDAANKQAVAELNNRHGLNLIAAEKLGKADHILLMNDDFIQGHIKLLPESSELKKEYEELIWETDSTGRVKEPKKENPTLHNDLCDSALYLWKYAYPYLYRPPEPFTDRSQQEVWEGDHINKLIAESKNRSNPNSLDLEWEKAFEQEEEDKIE